MVVDEDERAPTVAQGDSERVARADMQSVQPAARDSPRRAKTLVPVEHERPELFVIERGEARARPSIDRCARGKASVRPAGSRDRDPPPELDCRRDARCFCETQTSARGELSEARARQAADPPALGKERRSEDADRLARASGPEDERDELRIPQCLQPILDRALARPGL